MSHSPSELPKRNRYEYRVFDTNLDALAETLATCADAADEKDARHDIYIVSRLTIDANVKVRGSRLTTKLLEARHGLLELWAPALDVPFPIAPDVLTDDVGAPLGVDFPVAGGAAVETDALAAMVGRHPALALCRVEKDRLRFRFGGGGMGEFARLRMSQGEIQTVAVEAADTTVANGLVEQIGLRPFANESYPAFLQRLLFR